MLKKKRIINAHYGLRLVSSKSYLTDAMCLKDLCLLGSQILALAEFQWERALRSSALISKNRIATAWFLRTCCSPIMEWKVALIFLPILLSLKLPIEFWRFFSKHLSFYCHLSCENEKGNGCFLCTIFLFYSLRPGITK